METPKVIYLNMPPGIKGYVVKMFDEDGDYYTIVINPKYNWEQQLDIYDHEMKHIEARDFESMLTPDMIEAVRHAV